MNKHQVALLSILGASFVLLRTWVAGAGDVDELVRRAELLGFAQLAAWVWFLVELG